MEITLPCHGRNSSSILGFGAHFYVNKQQTERMRPHIVIRREPQETLREMKLIRLGQKLGLLHTRVESHREVEVSYNGEPIVGPYITEIEIVSMKPEVLFDGLEKTLKNHDTVKKVLNYPGVSQEVADLINDLFAA